MDVNWTYCGDHFTIQIKKAKDIVIVKRYYVSVNHLQILNNQVGKISKKIKYIGEQVDQSITICSSVYFFL